ncbi:hypothetical protein ABW20_dc0103108 [Dactylellina cionopaga]|nr:hypothetical protein ABW20_dc0103108 [Dactylellina cionopaga]
MKFSQVLFLITSLTAVMARPTAPIGSTAPVEDSLTGAEMKTEFIWTLDNEPLEKTGYTKVQTDFIRAITDAQWVVIAEAYNNCSAVALDKSSDRSACPRMIEIWKLYNLGVVPDFANRVWTQTR